MLKIIIEGVESFDDSNQTFKKEKDVIVCIEHSLVSLSKWEAFYQKPFLTKASKSKEEMFEYLKYMIISPNVDPDVFDNCSKSDIDKIQSYIDSSQSATTFGTMPERRGHGETITSELIYYWMILFGIPFECQHWHLNRLFALIKICNIKTSKPKNLSKFEIAQRNRELNAQRRSEWGTRG